MSEQLIPLTTVINEESATLRARILTSRLEEMSAHEQIINDLRTLNLGARATKLMCERELGYSFNESRAILSALGLIVTSEALTSTDPKVRTNIDKLREWRKTRAKQEGVPAYRVLTNRVLLTLASDCPKTPETLRELKGFGPKTAKVYEHELLALLEC